MVRRHVRSDFAADVYVFPGGKVDPEDADPALLRWVEGHPSPENQPEGAEVWRALRLAAVRELFEEAGVLLAVRKDGAVVRLDDADARRYAEFRSRLHAGDLTLLDLARHESLRYALDRLHPFSRWVTPEAFPRRFDTRFFVAFLPHGQEALHDTVETTESVWIAPREALRRFEQGEFPLVFATEKHLERLASFHSIEEMIASTQTADLQPVMPKAVEQNGRQAFLLPGDEGYS